MGELKASYLRCRQTNRFAECHYRLFLNSHSDIPKYFENIDRREHLLLLGAMHSVLWRLDEGGEQTKATMLRLARKHGRMGLNIPEYLYRFWLTSLVEAVSECDPDNERAIEEVWRTVGQKAIDFFARENAD